MFQRAARKRAYIKLALTGPSGSGKTMSALRLARGLVGPEGRIAVLDTENESASLYSDRIAFDTAPICPPFTVPKYIEVIEGAARAGYDVLVIDSMTHAWAGEGGLLSQKEALDARGGNSFTNWAGITKQHESLKAAILQSPIHVIATMRSKQEYVVEQGSGGKSAPKKVGMAPIQRDGMEYEFTTVLDIGMGHEAVASKDRTTLFDGVVGLITEAHGERLRAWLDMGVDSGSEEGGSAPSAPAGVSLPTLADFKALGEGYGFDYKGKPDNVQMHIRDLVFGEGVVVKRPITGSDIRQAMDRLKEQCETLTIDDVRGPGETPSTAPRFADIEEAKRAFRDKAGVLGYDTALGAERIKLIIAMYGSTADAPKFDRQEHWEDGLAILESGKVPALAAVDDDDPFAAATPRHNYADAEAAATQGVQGKAAGGRR